MIVEKYLGKLLKLVSAQFQIGRWNVEGDSYAIIIKVPPLLTDQICSVQYFLASQVELVNKEIVESNQFLPKNEQAPLLGDILMLRPSDLHITLQMIADGKKIRCNDDELSVVKSVLAKIVLDVVKFGLLDNIFQLNLVLFGHYIALEYDLIPQELIDLQAKIKTELACAGIFLGPVYPSFRVHISIAKTVHVPSKLFLRGVVAGFSQAFKQLCDSLPHNASTDSASVVNEVLLTMRDKDRNNIPLEIFALKEHIS